MNSIKIARLAGPVIPLSLSKYEKSAMKTKSKLYEILIGPSGYCRAPSGSVYQDCLAGQVFGTCQAQSVRQTCERDIDLHLACNLS